MKKHNKRQNKHYGQGQGHGHSSTSSSSYVNCHHGSNSGYDSDESSSSDVQYFKSPTKYYYSGTQEDGHDMFDKVLKQIEKSVLKYIKQLESEGKIMLFDTKTQSMYPSSSSHDTDTKKKLKKFNTEVFDPSDGFRTDIYNDINSMVFKGGKSVKSKNEYNGSGGGNSAAPPYRFSGNNNQQKYSSSVSSQYFVNEDDFIPSSGSGPGYDDNYKSSSSSSTSTTYGDDGCRYSYPSNSQSSNSQPYPSQDYNNDGYPIMNPYQFVFNQDKYGRHKKDLGSKCGGSYRH